MVKKLFNFSLVCTLIIVNVICISRLSASCTVPACTLSYMWYNDASTEINRYGTYSSGTWTYDLDFAKDECGPNPASSNVLTTSTSYKVSFRSVPSAILQCAIYDPVWCGWIDVTLNGNPAPGAKQSEWHAWCGE